MQGWSGVEELLPYLDVVIPNEIEATSISGKDTVESAARHLLEKGVKCVVVTLGPEGAMALVRDSNSSSGNYGIVRHIQEPAKVHVSGW